MPACVGASQYVSPAKFPREPGGYDVLLNTEPKPQSAGGGGELQNHYNMRYLPGYATLASSTKGRTHYTQPSALYARKQTLQIPTSIVSPSGIPIPETASIQYPAGFSYTNVGHRIQQDPLQADWGLGSVLSSTSYPPGSRGNFAGDTYWDAPTQAGIMVKTGSTFVF